MLVQGVEVDVPKVASAPLNIDDQKQHIIIALKKDGQALIERGDEEPAKVTDEEISKYVGGVLKQDATIQILLRADSSVQYGRVMGVMSSLQASGIESVGLVTEAPDEL